MNETELKMSLELEGEISTGGSLEAEQMYLRGPQGPQGERGVSGVYTGPEEPTDPEYTVWVDTSDETISGIAEESVF